MNLPPPRIAFLLVLACTLGAPIARADTGWRACLTDLTLRRVNEPWIESGVVRGIDDDGRPVRFTLSEVFYLLPARAPDPIGSSQGEESPIVLSLVDAQRLPVTVLEPDEPGTIRVRSMIGPRELSIGLSSVRSLGRAGHRIDPHDGSGTDGTIHDDRVVLVNGDIVRGFVTLIGRRVEIETDDGDTRRFPIERVGAVRLVNAQRVDPAMRLRLGRAAWIRAVSIETRLGAGGDAVVEPVRGEPFEIDIPRGSFGGVEITHESTRLAGLWTLENTHEPTGGRRWTPAPVVLDPAGDHDPLRRIDLRAPVRVGYALGEGSSRFACLARLVAGAWSDCELIIECVSLDGTVHPIVSARLTPSEPTLEVNEALPRRAARLIVRVEPGANGAIQDRVILESARVRIDAPSAQLE